VFAQGRRFLPSPQWRVQPGETALSDCPAPGRRPSVLILCLAARTAAALIMSGAFFSSKLLCKSITEAEAFPAPHVGQSSSQMGVSVWNVP